MTKGLGSFRPLTTTDRSGPSTTAPLTSSIAGSEMPPRRLAPPAGPVPLPPAARTVSGVRRAARAGRCAQPAPLGWVRPACAGCSGRGVQQRRLRSARRAGIEASMHSRYGGITTTPTGVVAHNINPALLPRQRGIPFPNRPLITARSMDAVCARSPPMRPRLATPLASLKHSPIEPEKPFILKDCIGRRRSR
jgi:hypothetical protein